MNEFLAGLQKALSVAPMLPYFIVAIQHLMPGHSGEDKKNAVIQLALAGGQAAGVVAPSIAGQSNVISQTVGTLVQSVYDGIEQNQPQALAVSPTNTGAQSSQQSAPDQNQPQTSNLG
jgi:hypothetical protein